MSSTPERPPGPGRHPRGTTVADIVRDVIAAAVPDELPLVEGLRRTAGDRGVRRLARRRREREPLGFGLGDVAVLATPVVWIAVDEAVRRGVDDTLTGARRRLRRLRRRRTHDRTVPPLTRAQLARVRARVLELAAKAGLDPGQAGTLADQVVARLVLEPGSAQGPADTGPPAPGLDAGEPAARPDTGGGAA